MRYQQQQEAKVKERIVNDLAGHTITVMYESGLWDSCELPSCEVYTFHFLWCLHAIKWLCDKLKGVKA